MICDRKAARVKEKVYKMVARSVVMYGFETVELRKRQEAELEVAEMKTRMDRIRNECVREAARAWPW